MLIVMSSGKYLLGNMLSALGNKRSFYEIPVRVEYSKLCEGVLKVLKEYCYIIGYKVIEDGKKKSIDVLLNIDQFGKVFKYFKLLSKPGCRLYYKYDDLKKMFGYNNFALIIVSTSKGIISIKEAVKGNIGGEVLCEIM